MTAPALTLNDRGVLTVKETDEWLVELIPTVFNWRLCLTPKTHPEGWSHAWCYFGADAQTLLRAWASALVFDPVTESAPPGYDKALTSRR